MHDDRTVRLKAQEGYPKKTPGGFRALGVEPSCKRHPMEEDSCPERVLAGAIECLTQSLQITDGQSHFTAA
jgi:hypothetical protein